jgi:hypothetical protein
MSPSKAGSALAPILLAMVLAGTSGPMTRPLPPPRAAASGPAAADWPLHIASAFGATPSDVAVYGHFALVAVGPSIQVFDLADALRPRAVGHSPVLADDAERLLTVGEHLVVLLRDAGFAAGRVVVFSLAELPRLTPEDLLPDLTAVVSACAHGEMAYLFEGYHGEPRLNVVSMPPGGPVRVLARLPLEQHDTGSCAARDGYVYRAGTGGLTTFDARQPATARVQGTLEWPIADWNPSGIALDGSLLAVAGGVGPPDTVPAPVRTVAVPFLRTFDLSDPARPLAVSSFTTEPAGLSSYPIGLDVALGGGYAFVVEDFAGALRVVDLADALRPRQLDRVAIGNGSRRVLLSDLGGASRPLVVHGKGVAVLSPVSSGSVRPVTALDLPPAYLQEHGGQGVWAEGSQLVLGDVALGLRLFDFSRSAWPTESRFAVPGRLVAGLAVGRPPRSGVRLAFVIAYGDHLLSLAWPPEAPLVPLGSLKLPEYTAARLLPGDEGYVYAASMDHALVAVDVRDPSRPALSPFATTESCTVPDMARYGAVVYSACLHEEGGPVFVVDVSRPAAPRVAGRVDLSASRGAERAVEGLQVAGSRLYLRRGGVGGGAGSEIMAYDLAEPLSPRFVGRVAASVACPQGSDFDGYVGYVVDCYGRLHAVNVADPLRQRYLAHVDVPGQPQFADVHVLEGLVLVDRGDRQGFIAVSVPRQARLALPWLGRPQ